MSRYDQSKYFPFQGGPEKGPGQEGGPGPGIGSEAYAMGENAQGISTTAPRNEPAPTVRGVARSNATETQRLLLLLQHIATTVVGPSAGVEKNQKPDEETLFNLLLDTKEVLDACHAVASLLNAHLSVQPR